MSTTRRSGVDDEGDDNGIFAPVDLWIIIAEKSGFVGAWRLMGVCRASREGARVWLRALPSMVVSGGRCGRWSELTSNVWRLDLAELRWKRMPNLTRPRYGHACCAVRWGFSVLGGVVQEAAGSYLADEQFHQTASVEFLEAESVLAQEEP